MPVVHFLDFQGDDEELLAALKANTNGARRAFFERYGNHVERVLVRIMGPDDEIPDLISETFLQAFKSVHTVKSAKSLKAWVSRVGVFVARGKIRKRRRLRRVKLFAPNELPETASEEMDMEGREALRIVYAILDEIPADERIVFALRFLDGKGFIEIGEICGVSRATLNRRLGRAQEMFLAMAKGEPLLAEWIERGTRWQV